MIFGEGDLNTAFRVIDDSGDGEVSFFIILRISKTKFFPKIHSDKFIKEIPFIQ